MPALLFCQPRLAFCGAKRRMAAMMRLSHRIAPTKAHGRKTFRRASLVHFLGQSHPNPPLAQHHSPNFSNLSLREFGISRTFFSIRSICATRNRAFPSPPTSVARNLVSHPKGGVRGLSRLGLSLSLGPDWKKEPQITTLGQTSSHGIQQKCQRSAGFGDGGSATCKVR
jgi:hypothetical protein